MDGIGSASRGFIADNNPADDEPFSKRVRRAAGFAVVVGGLGFLTLYLGPEKPGSTQASTTTTTVSAASKSYIDVPLPDGAYTIMWSAPSSLVQQFLRDHPDQEITEMGSLLQLRVVNGQPQVKLAIKHRKKQ